MDIPAHPSVAVIDIGSNSIKVLVAARDPAGQLIALKLKSLDARISMGISEEIPRLSPEGLQRGLDAVTELLVDVAVFNPSQIFLIATSAVRDALNGADFTAAILDRTGHSVRILSGDEEAHYIGRGLTCDPALNALRNFNVFDLGGGSLECLAFRDRRIVHAISLPLGCVRLTESCVKDSSQPFTEEDRSKISATTRETFVLSGFDLSGAANSVAVGTGGTLTTARAVLAALRAKSFEESDTLISTEDLHELFERVANVNLTARRKMGAMPAARADVFPTALATLITLSEIGGFSAYRNSLYNLRWGVADEALSLSESAPPDKIDSAPGGKNSAKP